MPHDDDWCPEMGFIMGGGNKDRRTLFSECSNEKIKTFLSSTSSSCLRAITGYATTPKDHNFTNAQAPTIAEQCQRRQKDQNAWVEPQDINFQESICKWRNPSKPGYISSIGFSPVDNCNKYLTVQ